MTKRLLYLLTLLTLFFIRGIPAHAQSGYTTVTATVTDANGNVYANAPYTVSFYDPGTSGNLPLLNGSVFQTVYVGYATDGNGNLSISLPDNNVIASSSLATNTQWRFNICSRNAVPCFQTLITITGASQDISATLKAASAPLSTTLPGLGSNNGWFGQNTFNQFTDFQGRLSISGAISFAGNNPIAITGDVNDYAGCNVASNPRSYCRITTDASRNMTGISAGFSGQMIILQNSGSFNLVLKNLNGASSAANQFSFGSDITLQPNHSALMIYDSFSAKWRSLIEPAFNNPLLNGTPSGTGIATIVQKQGSNSGVSYSTTSASYSDMDGTNLSITQTVPTGWKAILDFSFVGSAATSTTADGYCISDGTFCISISKFMNADSVNKDNTIHVVFTGDGASHTFKPRWASDGTHTLTAANATTNGFPTVPLFTMLLIPSN